MKITSIIFLSAFLILPPFGYNQIKAKSISKTAIASPASSVSVSSPEAVGMSSAKLSGIDAIVKEGLDSQAYPGCQVLVIRKGVPVYDKCFGKYTYESNQKVTPATIYDLASLSKTTGTLLAVMKLYDVGKLTLKDKVSQYLPFLQGTDKADISISELLFHESGLPASLPFFKLAIEKSINPNLSANATTNKNKVIGPEYEYKDDWASKVPSAEFTIQAGDSFYIASRFHDAAMQMIARTPLRSKKYVYSCVNFILLKEIVEKICGISMDLFLNREYFTPMNLSSMSYQPLRSHKREEIAPTLKKDFLRNGVIQGYVHDPDAAFLGGVSGNAGLFSTAHDVARVYQMLLDQGQLNGKRYLSEETCRIFTTTTSPSGRRGLGFDKPVPSTPNHSPCAPSTPAEVYGHTGYTGTCCWIDPTNDMIYVFLSNRTYPNDGVNKLARMGIRTRIQELVYQSIFNQVKNK